MGPVRHLRLERAPDQIQRIALARPTSGSAVELFVARAVKAAGKANGSATAWAGRVG
jgi:hypothetical protein